ncbi:uncharacterized protein CC84DRAFT_1235435 [Paraphaeosphaeria sporulosa]|uniref:Uncharacterized protein n=1 Tax=Paraphaeosphaeria sporulosa TaxID=1460663 RepID=A0A177CR39_9PLEO|nr:uncharacterized protein CC84DRAFT_1235435 [Paraphaeosphaeria sporulosa]OAG09681.1 hypothetical protein CC84DRAFT_1235435 [Paraphaeosphaeria sporulosa]
MLQSPVSPESPDVKHGARPFARIHNYEAGLEVAENQNREKNDLDPVVVLSSPVETDSPLFITHGRWAEAPQPIDSTSPQAMGDAALEAHRTTTTQPESDAAKTEKGSTLVDSEEGGPRRWCGLGRKVMLLIIVLVILLVAAIIGGAVGGTLAKKSAKSTPVTDNNADTPQSSTASQSTTASARRSGDSPTATEATGPHVRFRLQTYDDYEYRGKIQVFEDPGLFKPKWDILSYNWTPARSGDLEDTSLLRCSVAFCANQTVLGWRGASIMEQPGSTSANHSANFIHIACDQMYLNPECMGLGDPDATSWATTKDDYSQVPSATPTTDGDTESTRSTTLATTTPPPKSRSSFSSNSKSTSGSGSSPDTSSAAKTQA